MSDGGGDHCTVCLYKMKIYSIGECNHPVCHACSTRMRVLCQRNECAICRRDLPKVILSSTDQKYDAIKDNIYQMDKKTKICFESDEIQKEYTKLLDHTCPVCEVPPTFKVFRQLDTHMRAEHKLYFCDLCVSHLTNFSHERKYYDRAGLMEHRRTGDKDDSSHKGHPLCEFCDKRFVDSDELFKHLRKDHYFCHFCDADGNQYFYSEYNDLRQHFKDGHYLCEEPECEAQKFVVFRSEIDIKAHRLELHSSNLSKAATKQSRRVDLEFSFNREERSEGRHRREDRRRPRSRSPEVYDQLDGPPRENVGAMPDLVADFPTLGAAGPAPPLPKGGGSATDQRRAQSGELAKKLAASAGHNTGAPQSWAGRGGSAPALDQEFPSLPGAPKGGSSRTVPSYKPSQPKPKPTAAASQPSEAFPGLPASSRPMPRSMVVAKPKPAVSRPAPTPAFRPPAPPPVRSKPPPARWDDDESDEDYYPSLLGGPGRPLNNFSDKTVRSSGQMMDYTSTAASSNINIIDKSVIEALRDGRSGESKGAAAKPRNVKSTTEFPGLGAPETTFNLMDGAKKSNKKNKNKNSAPKNLNNNKPKAPLVPSSLSSIADMLGPPPSVAKPNCDNKQKGAAAAAAVTNDIKPVPSKLTLVDHIDRPSKQKPLPAKQEVKKVVHASSDAEEFPSLGGATRRLGANFVKAEDKLIRPAKVESKWGGAPSYKESNGNSSSSPAKTTFRAPPGLTKGKSRGNKNYQYLPPEDFQARNMKLVSAVSDMLGGKSLEFKTFREISQKFRSGGLKSPEYFSRCCKLVDEAAFASFFPELLALLPDIRKQEGLLELFAAKFPSEADNLFQCSTCGQVLQHRDVSEHDTSHLMDTDFPTL